MVIRLQERRLKKRKEQTDIDINQEALATGRSLTCKRNCIIAVIICCERTSVSGNRQVSHHTDMEGIKMSLAGISATTTNYAVYEGTSRTSTKAAQEKKETEQTTGAVYEKTPSDSNDKATYSINKQSPEQRAAIVKQMLADQEKRQDQLVNIVNKMLGEQAQKFTEANDDFWATLAKGGFSVDEAAKQKAQEAISEDGYYGVKQTSQRIFDFASALAGDDVEKMKEMQAAFEKGFKQATKAWGRDLPDISNDTHKAVTDLFQGYYDSKNVITED